VVGHGVFLVVFMKAIRCSASFACRTHVSRPVPHRSAGRAARHVTRTARVPLPTLEVPAIEGPSTDFLVIYGRLQQVWVWAPVWAPEIWHHYRHHLHTSPMQLALPYWTTSSVAGEARKKLLGVLALTLATTGVR
jgi:hypothetical protein